MKIGNLITIIITLALIGLLAFKIYTYKTSPFNPRNWFTFK